MITTRFAPSPTGYLHIGGLRTVLYNYLFAKKNAGKFMLRIEDTDRTRYVEGSVENMIKILQKVGLEPDEGPNNPGDLGPYMQSERLDIYKKYAQQLVDNGYAYYCFCSSERLEKLREEQQSVGVPTKYDGHCRYLSKDEVREKINLGLFYTIRLKVPKGKKISFLDGVKGMIEIDTKDVDDQVLIKTDGFPTYHLASVVDDYLMKVSHVIRGDEWIPSTPKHILLYEAFGWNPPSFYHLPLLLGTDKKKLSKRTGDVAVETYLEKGYLLDALINYIALLGWNPKTTDEFFSMDELIQKFDISQVHKAGAVFDTEKLNWMNSEYIKKTHINTLYKKLEKYLKEFQKDFYNNIFTKVDSEYNLKILKELQTRIIKFDEYRDLTTFFYNDFDFNKELGDLMINPKMNIESLEIVKKGLQLTLDIFNSRSTDFTGVDKIKNIFIEEISKNGMKNGQVLWPVRVALSGEKFSPGALELIYILGLKKSTQRLKKVLDYLK